MRSDIMEQKKKISKKAAPVTRKAAMPVQKKKVMKTEKNIEDEEEEVKMPIQQLIPSMGRAINRVPSSNKVAEVSQIEEDFEVKAKIAEESKGAPPSITAYMKFATNHLLLSTSLNQEIPCSIELQGSEDANIARSGIDIVCVIDVSGSMSGEKLELVQKTLIFMISRLDITDRISIITFSDDAKTLSPLITMNPQGKIKASAVVKKMHIEGGTEIILGVDKSLQLLASRKKINQVTSVLLLTDGVDNNGDTAMGRLEKVFAKYDKIITSTYTIHTFGYGADHQADLLNSISQKKSGGFYFVEKEASIPQIFSDCLGEMMSIVADSIFIELSTLPGTIPYALTKVFSETGDTSFKMPPVLAGEKKEAIFLLNFPPNELPVPEGHFERPVKALVTYTLTLTGERVSQEVFLQISVLNEGNESEIQLDEDVLVNFYRAKAASILREAAIFGDRGDMENARTILNLGVQEMKSSKVASHPTSMKIAQDLEEAVPRFQNIRVYEHGGKADLKSKANNHYNKRGMYKNSMQKKMMKEAEEDFEE